MDADETLLRPLRHGDEGHGAVVRAAALALDMDPVRLFAGLGAPTVAEADLVRFETAGDAIEFHGAFTYGPGSLPTGGEISGVVQTRGDLGVFTAEPFDADAAVVFGAIAAGDWEAAASALFQGVETISGSARDDTLAGWGGDDSILGGAGRDFVRGLDGDDYVDGGAGDDDLNGNMGDDIVRGGDGRDWVRGGRGDDIVLGEDGDDPHLNGNLGDDEVGGGDGDDTLFGGQGNDYLHGDAGNDWLSGDLGDDILVGGAGADRFAFRPGSGRDWVADFNSAEGDRIELAVGTAFTLASHEGQVVIDLGNGDRLGLAGVSPASLGDWLVMV